MDGIKAILEAGWGEGMLYDRLDLLLVRSVAEEARAQNLPLAMHTGDARDVTDAVEIGASSIEHGSLARRDSRRRCWSAWRARAFISIPRWGWPRRMRNYFGGQGRRRSTIRWCSRPCRRRF